MRYTLKMMENERNEIKKKKTEIQPTRIEIVKRTEIYVVTRAQ